MIFKIKCFIFYFSLLNVIYSQQEETKSTGVYNVEDGVMSTTQSEETEQLQGYPQASEINSRAISLYNDATELIYKKPDLAISNFKEAIEIEPKFVQAIDNLGKVYRIIEEYDLAEKTYKKSIAIFPNGPSAHLNLALVYRIQKKYQNAIQEYKMGISCAPNSPEGYYGIAQVYLYFLNDNKLAKKYAYEALSLYERNPPNYIGDSYVLIGFCHYYSSEYELAKKYIEKARKSYIENDLEYVFKDVVPNEILEKLSIK